MDITIQELNATLAHLMEEAGPIPPMTWPATTADPDSTSTGLFRFPTMGTVRVLTPESAAAVRDMLCRQLRLAPGSGQATLFNPGAVAHQTCRALWLRWRELPAGAAPEAGDFLAAAAELLAHEGSQRRLSA